MAPPAITETRVDTNGTQLHVVASGSGPNLLLMHGFPHTWRVWEHLVPALSVDHRVIAPDLRGLGASRHEPGGYDARNLALDMLGLLDALDAPHADVVALDMAVCPAFLLALEHPDRVRRLVLMEALVGRLPGAEVFLRAGPPWWVGFHAVPGLAESVLQGHEAEYIDFFVDTGTSEPDRVDPPVRQAFVDAYSGKDALRSAFEHYRAGPTSSAQIEAATSTRRLTVPTLAIGGRTVGDATARQLDPITNDLTTALIPESGHIIPLDRPQELLQLLRPFFGARVTSSGD